MPSLFSPKPFRIGALRFVPYRSNGWSGWLLDTWADCAALQDLEKWLEQPEHTCVLEVPCRTITRVDVPHHGVVYTKRMRAQNDGVLEKNELFSKFKWVAYPSRARHIVKCTAEMLACGHFCPTPILGVRKRSCLLALPQDLFIATELCAPTVEERLKNAASPDETAAILRTCGERLCALHRDHFIHGDFLPRNVCLDHDGVLSYLDNDRTRRWPFFIGFHFQRRNLTQFCFNLYLQQRSNDHALSSIFIEAYGKAAAWSERRLNSEKKTIFAQNDKRWAKTSQRELQNL